MKRSESKAEWKPLSELAEMRNRFGCFSPGESENPTQTERQPAEIRLNFAFSDSLNQITTTAKYNPNSGSVLYHHTEWILHYFFIFLWPTCSFETEHEETTLQRDRLWQQLSAIFPSCQLSFLGSQKLVWEIRHLNFGFNTKAHFQGIVFKVASLASGLSLIFLWGGKRIRWVFKFHI